MTVNQLIESARQKVTTAIEAHRWIPDKRSLAELWSAIWILEAQKYNEGFIDGYLQAQKDALGD